MESENEWQPEPGRVYHMSANDLLQALPPESVQLIATDPPYGIQYKSGRKLARDGSPAKRTNTFGKDEFDASWLAPAYNAFSATGSMYMFTQFRVLGKWWNALECTGFKIHGVIVWDKEIPGMGNLETIGNQCELILVASKGQPYTNLSYNRAQWHNRGNVWRLNKICIFGDEGNYDNVAQKPESLMRSIIGMGSEPGQVVVDPFLGSGSTAIAAQTMNRVWYGCDVSECQVSIARERIAKPYTQQIFEDTTDE